MKPLTCPHLAAIDGIAHGFFGREGGVSDGIYASLNCGPGSGDDLEKVKQNRAIVTNALGQKPESLCTLHQVHSANVVTVLKLWDEAPQADALATNVPGITLGILTADCVPVLFADAKNRVIAAAHAGWKGAISGVVEATIEAMCALGATKESISAAIGPCIAQGSYEVGEEFRGRFLEEDEANGLYFIAGARPAHYLFDLPGYVQDRLKNSGLHQINLLAHDTCSEENSYFSYRRATLRNEPAYGRQISAIVLTK